MKMTMKRTPRSGLCGNRRFSAQHCQSSGCNARRVHAAINSSSNGHSYLHRASACLICEQIRGRVAIASLITRALQRNQRCGCNRFYLTLDGINARKLSAHNASDGLVYINLLAHGPSIALCVRYPPFSRDKGSELFDRTVIKTSRDK